jgi:cell division transport system permease protein
MSYLLKEGFAGLRRTKWASMTSIFSLSLALLLLGVLFRLSYNLYDRALSLRDSVELEVFLYDLDDQDIQSMEQALLSLDEVESTSFISKDSAASIMRAEFGSGVEDLVALDFLPASFKLSLSRDIPAEEIIEVAAELEGWVGIENVKYNASLLQLLETNLQTLTRMGTGIGLLVLLAAMLLVFNTIRLTVYARRDVIKAMKLVGATNGFIRAPFVLHLSFARLFPRLAPEFGLLVWPFGQWYYLIGAMMVLSILMGWLGSRWAAGTFIRKTQL